MTRTTFDCASIGDVRGDAIPYGFVFLKPDEPMRRVYHWFEMCDAVQNESYIIVTNSGRRWTRPIPCRCRPVFDE